MLEVRDLTVSYGGSLALQSLSVTVGESEAVALLGSNGAGKTTLLKAISGLVAPQTGEIHFDGEPVHGFSAAHLVRLGVIHVPEGRQVFPELTVDENLSVGAIHRRGRAGVEADRADAYDLFPRLKDRVRQIAGTLSGGEQQMLVIGRALMGRPRLLLLDEPSLGLSPLMVKEIFRVVRELNASRKTSVLVVEQNAREALRSTNRAYVIASGRVTREDSSASLSADGALFDSYAGS